MPKLAKDTKFREAVSMRRVQAEDTQSHGAVLLATVLAKCTPFRGEGLMGERNWLNAPNPNGAVVTARVLAKSTKSYGAAFVARVSE